jgi:hypothetical protein
MNFEGDKFCLGEGAEQWRFVVHDHRAVVAAAWAAYTDGLFSKENPPLLLRWDAHHDFTEDPIALRKKYSKVKTLEGSLSFANSLESTDGSWANTVVRLGLVGNAATFYVKGQDQLEAYGGGQTIKDDAGVDHRVYAFGRFSHRLLPQDALGYQGATRFPNVANDLGWNHQGKGWQGITQPIWLDIDLDFAVHWMTDGFRCRPWSRVDQGDEFRTPYELYPYAPAGPVMASVAALWLEVFQKAQLVTIATEPAYACGYDGVATILEGLQSIPEFGSWFSWCNALKSFRM